MVQMWTAEKKFAVFLKNNRKKYFFPLFFQKLRWCKCEGKKKKLLFFFSTVFPKKAEFFFKFFFSTVFPKTAEKNEFFSRPFLKNSRNFFFFCLHTCTIVKNTSKINYFFSHCFWKRDRIYRFFSAVYTCTNCSYTLSVMLHILQASEQIGSYDRLPISF